MYLPIKIIILLFCITFYRQPFKDSSRVNLSFTVFLVFAIAAMVSLSLNSLKQIMKAVADSPGFDRVLSKVGVC